MKEKMLKDIDAVIFDMDGTLIDSMWVWEEIDKEYLERYNLEYTPEFHDEIGGMNFFDTAKYFKEKFNIADSIDEIIKDWHDMANDKYLYEVNFKEGVLDFIAYLRQNKIKTGIATSNSRELVDAFLRKNDAMKLFDFIATSTEVPASKPAPDIYLAVSDNLGISPKRCLVFEDIPNGILAGRNANMKTCAVYDKHSEINDKDKKSLADYYIMNYREISLV